MTSTISEPIYKASAYIPTYSTKTSLSGVSYLTKNEVTLDNSDFTKLLDKKVQAAKEEMQKKLNDSLWGSPIKAEPVRNEELRRCLTDAYEKHINQNITNEAPIMEALKRNTRKADMNEAVEKVMAERLEDRAREALVTIDEWLEEFEVGSVRSWTVQFAVGGKVYNYAAVFAGDSAWYITNRTGGMKTETFKAQLTEWALKAHEVVVDEGQIL